MLTVTLQSYIVKLVRIQIFAVRTYFFAVILSHSLLLSVNKPFTVAICITEIIHIQVYTSHCSCICHW